MIKTVKYDSKYDEQIKAIDMVLYYTIMYHSDVFTDTVLLAVREEDDCLTGVGYLKAGATFLKVKTEELPYYFIHGEMFVPEDADAEALVISMDMLIDALKKEFEDIQAEYPGKRLILRTWSNADNKDYLEFLMVHGFRQMRVTPIMVKNLVDEDFDNVAPQITVGDEILEIKEMDPNDPAFLREYMVTNREAFEVEDSAAELLFMLDGGDSHLYAVMKGDKVIAAVSSWQIDDRRATTENIFCKEEYRHKGVTTALIKYVLGILKERDYEEASLTVFGDNQPAMQLYLKLGYELNGTLIECHYEREYRNIGY